MRSSNGNGPADPILPASEEMWVRTEEGGGERARARENECVLYVLCCVLWLLIAPVLSALQAGMAAMALELLRRP